MTVQIIHKAEKRRGRLHYKYMNIILSVNRVGSESKCFLNYPQISDEY